MSYTLSPSEFHLGNFFISSHGAPNITRPYPRVSAPQPSYSALPYCPPPPPPRRRLVDVLPAPRDALYLSRHVPSFAAALDRSVILTNLARRISSMGRRAELRFPIRTPSSSPGGGSG